MKPVALMRHSILNHTKRSELVYEPFLGSGTTLAAAIGLGRAGFGIEINPAYEALIVERKREPEGFASERENAMAFLDM